PRALETGEIAGIVAAYRRGAENAVAAGFDGVELHGANGYLIEQFLQSRSNQRTDRYGGSIGNRTRLLIEVVEELANAVGADRVGVRLSPFGNANGSGDDEWLPLYSHAISVLAALDLAYLHLIEPRASATGRADLFRDDVPSASELFRPLWDGVLIAAGGYDGVAAERTVAAGQADAIAFGRAFIANPDLVARIRNGSSLNAGNRASFYGGAEAGYTDYPVLAPVA
ncbi:MAG: 12-oxophytodienoate reductase, partial [Rhizobium sp.]|nr:12-oxophytodienoate reductase [Rhizobium sp.]